jgi:hypothetical protein
MQSKPPTYNQQESFEMMVGVIGGPCLPSLLLFTPCHLHFVPTIFEHSLHTILTKGHERMIWDTDSSTNLHREHQLGPSFYCFLILSHVGTLFSSKHHINTHDFDGHLDFHRLFHHHFISLRCILVFKCTYPNFGV